MLLRRRLDFIIQPMDFLTIDRNIRKKLYKSTEALLSDVKWIVHNCYIYNDQTHPLTANAKVTLPRTLPVTRSRRSTVVLGLGQLYQTTLRVHLHGHRTTIADWPRQAWS